MTELNTAERPIEAPTSGEPASRPVWRPDPKSKRVIAIAAVGALVAVLAILAAWDLPPFGGGAQATNNAYIRGRTTVIAPQVSGYVVEVAAQDYATVSSGAVLVRIDDRIYRARVAQARANVNAAIAAIAGARAQVSRARADMGRVNDLVTDGSVSQREQDQTLAALRAAEAQVNGRGGTLPAQLEAARAQLRLAEIDLEHTIIRAPDAGQLGEVGVRVGQYVTNGSQLFSLVPPERWVIANYREVQTARIEQGQRASFTVDALNGARFSGRVEQISPATGSEFSVLRPDNATGNFVKVAQRIGVRIAIDPDQRGIERLRPGMSVEARVDTRRTP